MTTELDHGSHIVVVGASAAGLSAAEALRRRGFAGRLSVIGAETEAPYDRPPLSKQVLHGTWPPEKVTLRSAEALDKLGAQWHLGVPAASLDTVTRTVTLADGSAHRYDGLVIATGVRPRRLPQGHDLAGVHVLRTLGDTLSLRDRLRDAHSLVVIGAGFLGAEVAAAARTLGIAVTMVDPMAAPLARQLGPRVAAKFLAMHVERGVDLRCGRTVDRFLSADGAVRGVVLDDGQEVDADAVLVAVGSEPAVDWLAGSGLDLSDGVVCDEFCLAASGIVAAGDVASWRHPWLGRMRVEHRMNATEQGMAAATTLLGERIPFAPVPYFWTDQYDCKVQAYGRTSGDLEFRVVEGDLDGERFAALYGDGTHVVGALTWNLPKSAVRLRASVVARTPWAELSKAGEPT